MEKPTKNWRSLRLAVLNRAERTVFEPFEPLYTIYASVCLCYLVGFARFKFFDVGSDYTFSSVLILLIAAICGALIPVLTGSVLTIHFAHRRLRKLAGE